MQRWAEEDMRGCSPMMQFSPITWHRNGNGGLPASSLGRLLSERHTETYTVSCVSHHNK